MLDEVIIHGSLKIITVNKGLVGVAFNNGELEILQPGRHVINKETWNFCSMLSTGQETIPIREITNLSSDNVGLRFEAALNIQVIDAAKAVTMLGRDLSTVDDTRVKGATEFSSRRFQNNVRDRARLALSIIIGNNPFTETFLATAATHTSNSKDGQNSADTSFKGIIHDAFMAKFSKEMSELCGIRVIDMSIEDIQIVNTDLDEALAQAAVKATELEMARIDRDVVQQRAITAVNALKIRAEGEGHAKRLDAHATAKEIEILTKAECARIHDMDKALSNSNKASKICEMIAATSQTVDASQSAVVVANDITHLSQILSGRSKK
jgi:regulator of protease activity HflC (stomatin/prohibitin superfamily)